MSKFRSSRLFPAVLSVITIAATLVFSNGFAADTPYEFPTTEQANRYQQLLEELRCLVCQNQSLSDSHAELAQDLRDEVYRMLNEGLSDPQIRDFMVARYGDFVLYNPPIKKSTYLLWFGPFALILLALFIVWRHVRRQQRLDESLTDEEIAFAKSLDPSRADNAHHEQ